MAIDTTRQGSKGGDPLYNPELRGVSEERGIVVGIVKANVHGSHMGVIQVYIPEMSTDEEDKSQWRTVRYCTPFYSRVDSTEGANNKNRYIDTKMPSGIVTPPPDLGTTVLCFFPHGKNNEGYYFACVPDTYIMQTLPEPTIVEDFESGPYVGGELNDKKNNPNDIVNWKSQLRPEDFITQKIVKEQGLLNDRVRGLNNSSYMRESPSEIIGISSKGRRITEGGKDFLKENASALKNPNTTDEKILEGLLGPTARRKGHSIALDDGDIDGNSNQIRLRTSTGHQILLNDSEGIIYVGNSTGTVWIELGNQGTMDVFANDSINFRSKNINFHADENIKFHSKGYTQVVSENELHLESGEDLAISSGGDAGFTSKKFTLNASGQMNLTGGATASIKASGVMAVSGSIVMLQGPSLGAQQVKPVRPQQKADPQVGATVTTVDRLPSKEPFAYHGEKNTTTSYTGGVTGGGFGIAQAFSVISAGLSYAKTLPDLGTAGDFSDFAGANNFGVFADDASASLSGLRPFQGTFNSATEALTNIGGQTFIKPISTNIDAIVSAGTIGTEITSFDFPNVIGNIDFTPITDTFGEISDSISGIVSELPTIGDIKDSWNSGISDLADSDLGKLVVDGSGKIVDIANQVIDTYDQVAPAIQKGITKINQVVPGAGDKLGAFLGEPVAKVFQVTDLIKQVDTGFSIGSLESTDIQGLNAAIVKVVGSNNASNFIDSTTKVVGKYGFDINQLVESGYVRPEAVFNDQLSQSNVWTGKDGVTSLSKFQSNIGVQEQIQQQQIASLYQKLINNGAITSRDGKQEIMAMITAASVSNADIAKQVRLGQTDISLVRNTTGIPVGSDILSTVKSAMQTGSAASNTVTSLANKKTSSDGLQRFKGTLKSGETLRNIDGVTYVVPADQSSVKYTGNNGGKKRELDNRIAALENDRNNLVADGNDNKSLLEQIDEKLTELYSQLNSL